MSLFQLTTCPLGIIVRWLSKCWKTFWHLWQVLLNSWACKIPVLINENNLAFHSKNKPHTSVVMWGMTGWADTDLISLYSVFCSRSRAWPWSIFLPFTPLVREWIPLTQKAQPFFLVLCRGRDGPSSIWTHTAVSAAVWGSTNSPSLHWIYLRREHFTTSSQIMGQRVCMFLKGQSFCWKGLQRKGIQQGFSACWLGKGQHWSLRGGWDQFSHPAADCQGERASIHHWLQFLFWLRGRSLSHLLSLKYCKGRNI